jgi:GntR family transcriptional repressor for pyruvate dehydrogenase complex
MYRKINNQKRLSLEVANQIKALIQNEKLKPGDKLPSEMELTKLFGVSRPTIREAVKSLIPQNVIEIVLGRGTFVAKNPGFSSDPLGLDFITDDNLHYSLIEVRMIIEPAVARLAAERASPDDIKKIGRVIEEMEKIVNRHEVEMDTELEFHRSIAEATRNKVIMRIVPVIMDAIVKIYEDAQRMSEEHWQAFQEHSSIYEGIRGREPERAFGAMRHHLEDSYRRTLSKRKERDEKKTSVNAFDESSVNG